jgi:phospholipase C
MDRRTFVKGAAAAAGVGLTGAGRADASTPPVNLKLPSLGQEVRRPRTPVEHIVVVMMENRSFDHMLGSTTTSTRRGSRPGTSSPRATGPMEFECPR